jgi:hypothetical protein
MICSLGLNLDGIRAFDVSITIRLDCSEMNEHVDFRFVQLWHAGLASSHYMLVRTGSRAGRCLPLFSVLCTGCSHCVSSDGSVWLAWRNCVEASELHFLNMKENSAS